ncbi:hypothetical protein D5086_001772 [Populus alba]|uniref:Uncharacterized protein n=1 Tax=Populus alba TaxID=43335 RepID=A0ACC4D0W1_POPAL
MLDLPAMAAWVRLSPLFAWATDGVTSLCWLSYTTEEICYSPRGWLGAASCGCASPARVVVSWWVDEVGSCLSSDAAGFGRRFAANFLTDSYYSAALCPLGRNSLG